tara:strand:+ start:281 stop:1243 length:963 start_codon:yes stop_codon:yes gene_type:complete
MNFHEKIVIGIRDSKLSKAQTNEFVSLADKSIEDINKNSFELKFIRTSGDMHKNERLDRIGGKGLFIKEIEERILNGEVDIGVHSMKDMPAQNHQDLEIFCYMKRLDNSDVLISNSGKSFANLNSGTVIGTSSIRRRSQILHLRKDLNIKLLRGNVDTRIKKLRNNEYDAIILAYAGVKRLQMENQITEFLDQKYFPPAAGQGLIGIQSKKNSKFKKLFSKINNSVSQLTYFAERSFLQTIDANCNSPVSVLAKIENDTMKLKAQIFSHDGKLIFDSSLSEHKKNYSSIGITLGKNALDQLGRKTIDDLDNLQDDFNYTP